MLNARRKETAGRVFVYRWWAPRKAGSKEERHQIQDIERYRSRFDRIEEALRKPGR